MALLNNAPPQFTWATKPAIANWPAYSPIFITDVGRSKGVYRGSLWYHHGGANWHPIGGSLELDAYMGSLASPVSSIAAGVTANTAFTLPGGNPQIPAGLLIPGSSILNVEARFKKTGTAGGVNYEVRIGALSSTLGDSSGITLATAATFVVGRMDGSVEFPASGVMTTDGAMAPGASYTYAGSMADQTSQIDTTALMYLGFDITTENVADGPFNLISYRIRIKV